LVESDQAGRTGAAANLNGDAQGSIADVPPPATTTHLERWHQAVRRGLWVAPEPRGTPAPNSGHMH